MAVHSGDVTSGETERKSNGVTNNVITNGNRLLLAKTSNGDEACADETDNLLRVSDVIKMADVIPGIRVAPEPETTENDVTGTRSLKGRRSNDLVVYMDQRERSPRSRKDSENWTRTGVRTKEVGSPVQWRPGISLSVGSSPRTTATGTTTANTTTTRRRRWTVLDNDDSWRSQRPQRSML